MVLRCGSAWRAVLARARRLPAPRAASGGPGGLAAPSAGALELRGEPDRFGGVSVRLGAQDCLDAAAFQRGLQAAIKQWQSEGRIAVWLHVPILQSQLITPAASLGFHFHHAEHDSATLTLWLGEGASRLPGYATHQVGVAGAVFDENTRKVLVVQDRNKSDKDLPSTVSLFPNGHNSWHSTNPKPEVRKPTLVFYLDGRNPPTGAIIPCPSRPISRQNYKKRQIIFHPLVDFPKWLNWLRLSQAKTRILEILDLPKHSGQLPMFS